MTQEFTHDEIETLLNMEQGEEFYEENIAYLERIATLLKHVSGDGETFAPPAVDPATVHDVRWVDPADGYAALDAELSDLGATPGTIVIGPGTIDDVTDNVTVPANTWLCGSGQYSTSLRFADNADLDVAGLIRVVGDNVVVSDMEIDGNRANVTDTGQEYGTFAAATTNLTFARLHVHDCPGYGFDPHSENGTPTRNLLISDCVASNNGLDGVTIAGIEKATVTGTVAYDNDRHGFNGTDKEANRVGFIGCHSYDNGSVGLAIQNSTTETTVIGGSFVGNDEGIRLGSAGGEVAFSTISDAVIARNDGYGINIRGSKAITISGCQFRDNTKASGNADISLQMTQSDTVATKNTLVIGCQFEGISQTYGIDERSGTGPTSVVACGFQGGYAERVHLTHGESNDVATLSYSG